MGILSLCHDVEVKCLAVEANMRRKPLCGRRIARFKSELKNIERETELVPGARTWQT